MATDSERAPERQAAAGEWPAAAGEWEEWPEDDAAWTSFRDGVLYRLFGPRPDESQDAYEPERPQDRFGRRAIAAICA